MCVVLVSYAYNCRYYYHVPILYPKTAQLNTHYIYQLGAITKNPHNNTQYYLSRNC